MKQVSQLYRRARQQTAPANFLGTSNPDPFGLLELACGDDADTDIVALHGLDGHREQSWTADNGVLWLRDLLPTLIPRARIFTYGYDVNTHGRDQLSTSTLYNHAVELITHLAAKRKSSSTEERPIIFVAHSLGGILLKYALIHAHSCSKVHLPEHKAVEVSTSSILYFGTPHQGANGADVMTTLLNILSAFGKGTAGIVKNIRPQSEFLQQQLAQYQSISTLYDTKFYFETYKTPITPLKKLLLVPQSSAVVPGAVNAEMVPLNKDHVTMVKFESAEDGAFQLISSHLFSMVSEAPEKVANKWKSQRVNEAPENSSGTPLKLILAPLPDLPYQEAGGSLVGRAHVLDWIYENFKNRRKLILYGIGGIGKTGIAVEYIYMHRRDYDIIFWVNGDTLETTTLGFIAIAQQLVEWIFKRLPASNAKTRRDYSQVAGELGLEGFLDSKGKVSKEAENQANVIRAVKEWLSMEGSGNWLMVFDNVDDLDSYDLTKFFPIPLYGRILITSRRRESCTLGLGYEVEALSQEDGVKLLIEKSQRGEADSDAHQIVRNHEGLPLAIELAGAYIAARQLSFRSYLTVSNDAWKVVFTRTLPHYHYGRSLVAAWEISFQAIEDRSQPAADLLLHCAFLGNENIPEQLFQGKLGVAIVSEALEQLFAFSLAKRGNTPTSFSIHPLVHAWARERLVEEQKMKKLAGLFVFLGDAIPRMSVMSNHISTTARHAMEYYLPRLRSNSDISIFDSLEIIASREKGQLLHGMFRCALEATEMVEGPDSTKTLDAIELLAWSYFGYMKRSASRYLHQALEERERHSEVNPTSTFSGSVLVKQHLLEDSRCVSGQESRSGNPRNISERYLIMDEQHSQGERLQRYALERREKILGPNHEDTLRTNHDLAFFLWFQGRLKDAEDLARRTLQRREGVLGLDHPDTLETVQHLAVSLRDQEQYGEANKFFHRVIEGLEGIRGPYHIDTLKAVRNLALSLRNQGQYKQAKKLFRRELKGLERTMGVDHVESVEATLYLAGFLESQDQPAEAEKLYRRALKAREKVMGLCHADTLSVLKSLADLLYDQDQYKESAELDQQAFERFEEVLGFGHPDTLEIAHNLALSLHEQERFEEAEELCRRVLRGREKALGLDDVDTLLTIHLLAESLRSQDRFEEAETFYRRALEEQEKVQGFDHESTLTTAEGLALSIESQGRLDEVERLYRRILQAREDTLGLNDADTLHAAECLAQLLLKRSKSEGNANSYRPGREEERLGSGRVTKLDSILGLSASSTSPLEDAGALYRRVLKGRERTLGLNHIETICSVLELADVLKEQGRVKKAEKLYRRALEAREEVLGVDHDDTIWAVFHLASSLCYQHRFEEAEKLYRRAFKGWEKDPESDPAAKLSALHYLAVCAEGRLELEPAENLFRHAFEERVEVLGLDHDDTVESGFRLALVLKNQGRSNEAEKLFRYALASREKAMGLNHVGTLKVLKNLTGLLYDQCRYEDSEKLERGALERLEEVLGFDHPDTLVVAHDLALSMHEQNRLTEAEILYRRILERREKILGLDDVGTLLINYLLAETLFNQGRFEEAEKFYRSAIEGQGLDDVDTLASTFGLAKSLEKQGRFEEAEILYRRAYEGQERTLGSDDVKTLQTAHHLAKLMNTQDRAEEAERLHRQVLEGRQKILGSDHADTLLTVYALGKTVLDREGFEEAESLFRRVLKEERTGNNDTTIDATWGLALALYNQNQFGEAERLHRSVLQAQERSLGSDHTDTLQTLHSLATRALDQSRPAEAQTLYQRALERREKALGHDHAATLKSAWGLAQSYQFQGRNEEAGKLYRRILQVRETTLGFDHQETVKAACSLGYSLDRQNQLEEAEKLYRRVVEAYEKTIGFYHDSTREVVEILARLIRKQGQFGEAEKLYRRLLEGPAVNFELENSPRYMLAGYLALTLDYQGRVEEALVIYRHLFDEQRQSLPDFESNDLTRAVNTMISALMKEGHFEDGENLQKRLLAKQQDAIRPKRRRLE